MTLPCPELPNTQAALPITEQAVLDPPVLPALQGPPPPDVAELHGQVAAAQASALSSAEALAMAQQQVTHKQPGGSALAHPGWARARVRHIFVPQSVVTVFHEGTLMAGM